MSSVWSTLDVEPVAGRSGSYRATVADEWMLVVVPQGGGVAAIADRAMSATLDDSAQRLRTMSVAFAGQVALGPVEVETQVLRRGRSMSQLTATVRTPAADAGLTAIAVYGAERRGASFVDIVPPEVPGPDGVRSFRDELPEGVDFTFDRAPMPFWDTIVESRPVVGRAPWEPFVEGPSDVVYWYRLDDPPVLEDGTLDRAALIVQCDTMPGSVGQMVGPELGTWFGPSADYTFHLLGSARPGWLLAHSHARHAGDGYASIEMTLWDPDGWTPVAYGTQVMFFAFGR